RLQGPCRRRGDHGEGNYQRHVAALSGLWSALMNPSPGNQPKAPSPLPTEAETAFVGAGAGEPPRGLGFLQPAGRPGSLGRLGHYEVLGVRGRGGSGIVSRAFDEALRRVVALKVLAPERAAAAPARQRFLREARAAARVRHDNVVQTYAVEDQ